MDPRRDPRPRPRSALSGQREHRPRRRTAARDPRRIKWNPRRRMPRSLRPTQAGWFFFAITLGVGFAALNTGNNLLYLVLSLLLAFLVLSGVLSESALGSIRVRRRLPRDLYAERANSVVLEIENTHGRFPAFAVVLEDRRFVAPDAGAGEEARRWVTPTGRAFALRVGPGEVESRRYPLVPERRGPLELAHFAVSTRFPFGLFLKTRIIDAPEQALVYPAIDAMPAQAPSVATHLQGEQRRHHTGSGSDIAGVREFRQGDSLRRVHWRHSLRRNALLVREREQERASELEVRLHTRGVEGGAEGSDARFERSVRRAASEVVAALDAGMQVALRTDIERLPIGCGSGHRRRLLRYLAQVGSTPGGDDPSEGADSSRSTPYADRDRRPARARA